MRAERRRSALSSFIGSFVLDLCAVSALAASPALPAREQIHYRHKHTV